jgi:hypothetical protein
VLSKNPGRIILSLGAFSTGVFPFRADWNDSHVFSPLWSGHARFHGVAYLGMALLWCLFAQWLLWIRRSDLDTAALVAAMVPIAYWSPFFVAALVPGTALSDPGHPIPMPLGIPVNILVAAVNVIVGIVGLVVYRYVDRKRATAG